MDFENAAKLRRVRTKLMADALNLQNRIQALGLGLTRKLKDSQRVSPEFKKKKVRVSRRTSDPLSQPCPVVNVLDVDCESCAKVTTNRSSRLGTGESGSNSKKTTPKKEEKGAPNKETMKKDTQKVAAVASEDRELTKKKAVLAAAAFEKWVAEKTQIEKEATDIQSTFVELQSSMEELD